MTDPVAEAAANLAKQQSEPSLLDKAMDTIHDLEAKVEHLIHPEAIQAEVSAPVNAAILSTLDTLSAGESVPNVTPGSPATADSATLLDALGQSGEIASSAKPSESLPTETPVPASQSGSSYPSDNILTSSVGSDLPNVSGSPSITEATSEPSAANGAVSLTMASSNGASNESTPSAITTPADLKAMGITTDGPESEAAARQFLVAKGYAPESAEVPNAVSGAAESTTGMASAASASGSGETSSTGASSVEAPLHVRVALHLQAIFGMVKAHGDAAPTVAIADTSALKTHVGDILHRISNGMQVTQGELVQKLEALYRML